MPQVPDLHVRKNVVAPELTKSKVWLSASADPSTFMSSSPGLTLSIVKSPTMSD